METIARMRNEGDFEIVAEMEENNIETKGLRTFYDFSDTKLIDRKLCMKIDDTVFSTTRDNYPKYTSFDGDWKTGNYDVVTGGNSLQTGYIDVSEFDYSVLEFTVSGQVLVELSEYDCDIKVGVACRFIKPDGTGEYSWSGAVVGNTAQLKNQGWVDIFKNFKLGCGGKILCIKPWIQIEKNDVDKHIHRIIYKNITIEPNFETMQRFVLSRYIKLQCAGAYYPTGGFINHNNLYTVEAIDIYGNNVALNKPVSTDRDDHNTALEPPSNITVANPTSWNEYEISADKPKVTYIIDLGDAHKLVSVRVREWNLSTRKYLDKVFVSVDRSTWSLIQDSYTPFTNDEKQLYNDLPVTPNDNNKPLEFSLFGEMDGFITSATALASMASHLDNAMLYGMSRNTNVSWILDNTAPTKSRVVAKMDAPPIELRPTSSCRVETPIYKISQYGNRCFATAWVKVDKDYDGGTPNLTIEETPSWKGVNTGYDMSRKGEWQKLTVFAEWEPNESMSYFGFVRPIWNGNPVWTKGAVYVADLHFGGNPQNTTNLPYVENIYPRIYYSLPPRLIKPKGAIFLEFDLNNFNNKEWMSFFHIYTPLEGNVELKKINLIYNNRSKSLLVRFNTALSLTYPLAKCRSNNNRICLMWGDNGVYSILNGESTRLGDNVVEGDFEYFYLGNWIGRDNECNNNLYKLAIYDETLTVDDAISLTKPNAKVSLKSTTLESDNFVEGYNFTDELYRTGFNYFQLSDNFDEYHDKQIKLKNIHDYNGNAMFNNGALLITPRFRNRWKVAFGDTEYSYKNKENIVTLPTLAYSSTVLTVTFTYNTHELTDEPLSLNLTCFTGNVRDTTKTFKLDKTGDIYKEFKVTIPISENRNSNLEFSISGQGYARLKNIAIGPYSHVIHHEITEDDGKKLGFAMNLKESIDHDWSSGFTIVYKKKAITTSHLSAEKEMGYVIDSLGTYDTNKGYLWFGKYASGAKLSYGTRTNPDIGYVRNTIGIDYNLLFDWFTVALVFNPITKRLRTYYIFIDGTVEYIEVEYLNGYTLSYDELASTITGTNFICDLSINSWNLNNSNADACSGYLKDLLIVKRSMNEDEIKELVSPLSLGVDSIRAGMEISERNIL